MKKTLGWFVSILALLAGFQLHAQLAPTTDEGDTAGGWLGFSRHARIAAVTTSSTNFTIITSPSVGPRSSSPEFQVYGASEIALLRAGSKSSLLATYIVPTNGLIVSNNVGNIVWWWDAVVSNGGESISLDSVTVTLTSSDPGNSLGKITSFVGRSYSKLAFGVRDDGSIVDSGPADQLVKAVYFGVGSKYFIPSSPADIDEIKSILASGWKMTQTITVGGLSVSKSLGLVPPIESLRLKIGRANGLVVLTPESPGNYLLQSAPTPNGVFTNLISLQVGVGASITPSDKTSFFRLRPLPNP